MQLLHTYRSMLAAWIGITSYLFVLNTSAGFWYYLRLPEPPQAIASVPPPKPGPAAAEQSTQPGEGGSKVENSKNISRPGKSGPGPTPSDPLPPVIIDPPKTETPSEPSEPESIPTPTARGLLLGPEPAPLKLRRRLLVLVLVSTDLVAVNPVEEADLPLRANLQGVLEHFRSDLAGERIYAVGQQGAVAPWDLARKPGELLAAFEPDAYDAAFAAAGPAYNKIIPIEAQNQYDVLLVWYSHFRPDDAAKSVAMPAELASGYCLWAGDSSYLDSPVLMNLFPERRWLLRRDDPPSSLVGLIVGQLRRPQSAEGAVP